MDPFNDIEAKKTPETKKTLIQEDGVEGSDGSLEEPVLDTIKRDLKCVSSRLHLFFAVNKQND